MIYGYVRSNKAEAQSAHGADWQESRLTELGAQKIFTDIGGANSEKPELQKLLGCLQKGDRLIVTSLSKLTRNAGKFAELMKELREKGIQLYAGEHPVTGTDGILNAIMVIARAESESIAMAAGGI